MRDVRDQNGIVKSPKLMSIWTIVYCYCDQWVGVKVDMLICTVANTPTITASFTT
jgi:hypothetical protein